MKIEFLPESPAYGVLALAHGLWIVPLTGGAPEQLTKVEIWSGPTNGPRPWAPVAFDGGTTWLSSANTARTWNIFRYTGPGLEIMATFTDHPVSVAGPCA